MEKPQVMIVGGGFAGLNAAKDLSDAPVDVTVVDRTNHHLFQPLLYQVATGGLSPADIASPIRYILRRQSNARVLLDEVTDIDPAGRTITTQSGPLPYDFLIVATGATHHYFGNEGWESHAPGLKTLVDATRIRHDIFKVFEEAERSGSEDPALDFVVVGAGPTGVEMAGTIAEMARHTLARDFRHIDPASARVTLVEAADRVLGAYPEALSARASGQLEELGVEVRLGCLVTEIGDDSVTVVRDGKATVLPSSATVWAAGVKASPLAAALEKAGAPIDRAGRVMVNDGLTVPGHDEVFVIGDLAAVIRPDGSLVPGVAPAAIQMGRYAAAAIARRLAGESKRPFRYRDKGSLATIGRSAAVADFGRLRFSGWPAWAAWLGIHIFFLIGFENRLLVMFQWTWNYLTRNRSARLIVDYRGEGPWNE